MEIIIDTETVDSTKLVSQQNVKLFAYTVGKEIHNKELRVSGEFVEDISVLLAQAIKYAVQKQGSELANTIKSPEWLKEQIKEAKRLVV